MPTDPVGFSVCGVFCGEAWRSDLLHSFGESIPGP